VRTYLLSHYEAAALVFADVDFLAEVKERGGRLRQEFPGSCLPITCGRITGPLADFVSSASERSSDGAAPLGSHEL